MRQNNLTQEELAEKLGVSRGSVAKWVSGENLPSLDNLRTMRVLFNRNTIDELIEDDLHVKDSQPLTNTPIDQKILTALEDIRAVLKKGSAAARRKNDNFAASRVQATQLA